MKVLHIITDLHTGGAEVMLAKLLEHLQGSEFQSEVVCLGAGGATLERIMQIPIPVHVIGMKRDCSFVQGLLRVRRTIRSFNPDVIQCWMYHANLIGQLAAACTLQRKAVIWNIRRDLNNSCEKLTTKAVIVIGGKVSSMAAAIVYNAHCAKQSHTSRAGYNSQKAVVIPNGFDTQVFKPSTQERTEIRRELGISEEAFLIGSVGRYSPVKNQPMFLRACAIVASVLPDAKFLLLGRDIAQTQPLTELVAELGLEARVLLLNERSDVRRVIAAFDLAVSSSWVEGFSNFLGEAMSCGVPCVATDVGDSRLLIADTGRVVPAGDHQKLAAALIELAQMPSSVRQSSAIEARQRIIEEFSLEGVASRYCRLWESVALNTAKSVLLSTRQ